MFMYIINYLIILLFFFFFFLTQTTVKLLTTFSIQNAFIYLRRYNKYFNVLLVLFFLFSGLPPTIFFFIKLLILINIISKQLIFIYIFLFLYFFYSVSFYLQFLKFKNYKIQIYFQPLKLHSDITFLYKNKQNIDSYPYFNLFCWYVFFNVFCIFFFLDIYNICYALSL